VHTASPRPAAERVLPRDPAGHDRRKRRRAVRPRRERQQRAHAAADLHDGDRSDRQHV
jgi:hypothetical protein